MGKILQVVIFLMLAWLLVAGVYVVALPVLIYYLIRYSGFELIVLAIILDGYYFAFFDVPMWSIGATILVLLVNFIKPLLIMYTKDDETFS